MEKCLRTLKEEMDDKYAKTKKRDTAMIVSILGIMLDLTAALAFRRSWSPPP